MMKKKQKQGIIHLGQYAPNHVVGNHSVYSTEGLSPCLNAAGGGGTVPSITEVYMKKQLELVKDNNGNHFALRSQNKQLIETIQKNEFREGEPKVMDLYNRRANEKVSPTLDDPTHNDRRLYDGLRIRRLTPKECWRLMGFSDEDFEKARAVNSDTQLYKQAGNSIVVDVLVAILKNLLTSDGDEEKTQRELW